MQLYFTIVSVAYQANQPHPLNPLSLQGEGEEKKEGCTPLKFPAWLVAPSRDLSTLVIVEHGFIRFSVIPDSSAIFKAEPSPFWVVLVGIDPDAFTGSQDIRWEGE